MLFRSDFGDLDFLQIGKPFTFGDDGGGAFDGLVDFRRALEADDYRVAQAALQQFAVVFEHLRCLAAALRQRRLQLALQAFLTLSGLAYSNKNSGGTRVGSDLANLTFAADVAAPTSGRVIRWNGTNKVLVPNGATSDVTAADTPTWELLVQLKAYAKTNYIRGIREGGEETYHVFLSPLAMSKLKLDPVYMANLQLAQKRGDGNALFTGSSVKIDGLYIHEFRHVYNTNGTSTKWGSGNLIDGCQMLFCGAQSLGMADIGVPTWVEEDDDYENQQAIATAKIFGFLKPKFYTQYGLYPQTTQDFGVISVYVAQ